MNIVLNDKQRIAYADVIAEMYRKQPAMMSRKISRANVQQAWMVDTVRKFAKIEDTLLSVGCYEDTAYELLRMDGYSVIGIDPVFNSDVETYAASSSLQFDIVFSTSVIEHVADDEKFLISMISLMKPNGYGIFTCDFNNAYPSVPKPIVDERLYTINDLTVRIPKLLAQHNCEIHGYVDYSGPVDFHYEGCNYGFATCIFHKKNDD
jgi:hypothetical protein